MAVLPDSEYGTTSAASVGGDMVRTFTNVRVIALVGISGVLLLKRLMLALVTLLLAYRLSEKVEFFNTTSAKYTKQGL